MSKKVFSKEDLDDFKFGIKKGLIYGKINDRDIPPLHFEGYEFGVHLYNLLLEKSEEAEEIHKQAVIDHQYENLKEEKQNE